MRCGPSIGPARTSTRPWSAHNIAVPHNQIAADLVPYVWSDQHGRRIQHVGWSGAEVTERCTRRGTIFTYLQAGQVTGATGIDSPVREVMQVRRELQKDAPLRNS